MKKVAQALLVMVAAVGVAFGATAFKAGENVLSIGAGFGMSGIYGDAGIPPLTASFDRGINENVSVGGIVGYASSSQTWGIGTSYEWTYTYIIIGARGAYHFDVFKSEKWDTYAGAMLGYNIVNVSEPSGTFAAYSVGASYLSWAGFVGGRYYFNPKLNAGLELGYGISLIRAFIGFKL
jgi:hypothetical protein